MGGQKKCFRDIYTYWSLKSSCLEVRKTSLCNWLSHPIPTKVSSELICVFSFCFKEGHMTEEALQLAKILLLLSWNPITVNKESTFLCWVEPSKLFCQSNLHYLKILWRFNFCNTSRSQAERTNRMKNNVSLWEKLIQQKLEFLEVSRSCYSKQWLVGENREKAVILGCSTEGPGW